MSPCALPCVSCLLGRLFHGLCFWSAVFFFSIVISPARRLVAAMARRKISWLWACFKSSTPSRLSASSVRFLTAPCEFVIMSKFLALSAVVAAHSISVTALRSGVWCLPAQPSTRSSLSVLGKPLACWVSPWITDPQVYSCGRFLYIVAASRCIISLVVAAEVGARRS